jgi:hypothetical protein
MKGDGAGGAREAQRIRAAWRRPRRRHPRAGDVAAVQVGPPRDAMLACALHAADVRSSK